MNEDISMQIADLNFKRERIKQELLEKQARQAEEHHRYIAYGESIPLEDRLALQAEIAALEADRQATKVKLMEIKRQAKDARSFAFRDALDAKLKAIGMSHLIDEAIQEGHEAMLKQGFGDAYKIRS